MTEIKKTVNFDTSDRCKASVALYNKQVAL